ncbi:MAG: MFS transporter [Candidatus Tyrphobacter sp.]
MANRREVAIVFAAGIVQGTALVAFPATATILTSRHVFAFSPTQYGLLFLPQVVGAIVAALAGAALTRRVGIGRIFRVGLGADALSMLLFFAGRFALDDHARAFTLLLVATACLGIGFGLTVPTLNSLAAGMAPKDPDRAVLVLNALLGVGTVLAPLLSAVFVGAGIWWGLPLFAATTAGFVLVSSIGSLMVIATPKAHVRTAKTLSRRLPVYIVAAFLYGLIETTNGNWGELEMRRDFAAPEAAAAYALIAFWGCVTMGRFTFGSLERWLPQRTVYRVLPFVAAAAMAGVALGHHDRLLDGVLLFGLAGIGCSALFPLTISFAQERFVELSGTIAGVLIASYQVGYGVAAFAVGPLQTIASVALPVIYAGAAAIALIFGILSFPIASANNPAKPA